MVAALCRRDPQPGVELQVTNIATNVTESVPIKS